MSVSLSDILTAAKNIVTAINTISQNYMNVQGAITISAITTPTVLKSISGRVASVSVVVAGSANGAIYDSESTSVLTNKIFIIQQVVGITVVNLPVNAGIVVVPGTGQTVAVSYS